MARQHFSCDLDAGDSQRHRLLRFAFRGSAAAVDAD